MLALSGFSKLEWRFERFCGTSQVALKHMRSINAGVQRQIQQEVGRLTLQI